MRTRSAVLLCALAAIVAITLTSSSSTFAAALPLPVTNPGFELGSFSNSGGGYDNLAPGSTDIAGWTTVNQTISWAHVPNSDGLTSYDGEFFLDLTGPGAGTPGGLTQNVATTPGQEYSYTLALMTINVPVTVQVDAGAASAQFTTTGVGDWEPFTLNFTATGAVTPLTIQGVSGFNVIGVDAASIPEPSTLALTVIATGVLARRHRRG